MCYKLFIKRKKIVDVQRTLKWSLDYAQRKKKKIKYYTERSRFFADSKLPSIPTAALQKRKKILPTTHVQFTEILI